jgi:hypothetical protein
LAAAPGRAIERRKCAQPPAGWEVKIGLARRDGQQRLDPGKIEKRISTLSK